MLFTTIFTTLAALAPLTSAQLDVFSFPGYNCPDGKHNSHNIITDCNNRNGYCFRHDPAASIKLYGGDSVDCELYFTVSCSADTSYQIARIPKGKSNSCTNTETGYAFRSYRCWTNRPCCGKRSELNDTVAETGVFGGELVESAGWKPNSNLDADGAAELEARAC